MIDDLKGDAKKLTEEGDKLAEELEKMVNKILPDKTSSFGKTVDIEEIAKNLDRYSKNKWAKGADDLRKGIADDLNNLFGFDFDKHDGKIKK